MRSWTSVAEETAEAARRAMHALQYGFTHQMDVRR